MEHIRCSCCRCHTLRSARVDEPCPLCKWGADAPHSLDQARENAREYGVMYSPSDRAFAIVRHPILGPSGEYAIDRVALRARACIEFRAFGANKPERAVLTERLQALLDAIAAADRLYTK